MSDSVSTSDGCPTDFMPAALTDKKGVVFLSGNFTQRDFSTSI